MSVMAVRPSRRHRRETVHGRRRRTRVRHPDRRREPRRRRRVNRHDGALIRPPDDSVSDEERATVDLVRFAVDTERTYTLRVAFSHSKGDAHLSSSIGRWPSQHKNPRGSAVKRW